MNLSSFISSGRYLNPLFFPIFFAREGFKSSRIFNRQGEMLNYPVFFLSFFFIRMQMYTKHVSEDKRRGMQQCLSRNVVDLCRCRAGQVQGKGQGQVQGRAGQVASARPFVGGRIDSLGDRCPIRPFLCRFFIIFYSLFFFFFFFCCLSCFVLFCLCFFALLFCLFFFSCFVFCFLCFCLLIAICLFCFSSIRQTCVLVHYVFSS